MNATSPCLAACVLALLAAGGCATVPRMSDAERLSLYMAHAGEPVRDINYYTPIGWTEVDDQHIALQTRPSEEWLLTLSGPCLAHAMGNPALTISSQFNRVTSKFDRVSFGDPPFACRIEEIRPIDVKAMRAARAAGR